MTNSKGGRPATPAALRLLNGTHRDSRHGDADDVLRYAAKIEPPVWMVDSYALEEWERVIPLLDGAGLLSATDATVCASYCNAVADIRRAREEMAAEGATIQADRGSRNHPAWTRQKDAWAVIVRTSGMLGLSPSDRAGLSPGKSPKDDMAEFLKEQQT